MIPGLSYWSLEQGTANNHPLDDALQQTKDAGFEALELAIADTGLIRVDSSETQCQALREQIDASGLQAPTLASGMSWGCNPVSDDAHVREKALADTQAALQRAAWLGCEALLYVPGIVGCPFVPNEKIRYDLALQRCRDNVQALLETAHRVGVDLCLENVWNGMFLSPLELLDFIDAFNSPRLGVYFDVGNCLGYHQYPPHWIELLGPRIKRVHVKDFRHNFGTHGSYEFCRLGQGDVPWPQTFTALRSIGYDKTVVAEMLPPAPGLIEHTGQTLRRFLNGSA